MLKLINKTLLAELCFEGISNFVQRYNQTGVPRPKSDVTDVEFEFEFLDTLKDKEG